MKKITTFLAVTSLLIIACGKDKTTQPPAQEGSLLLNRLSISTVLGGSETVIIRATDPDGSSSDCTISNSDPSIASVTMGDSTFQITGLAYGNTDITVNNGSGKSCTLPVEVYNPFVLDTGELLITFTDDYSQIEELGYGPVFWKPIPPEGFSALSTFCATELSNPNGNKAMMVVKAKPGTNAIAFTDSFSTSYYLPRAWQPVPPPGYVAMGTVMASYRPDSAACIRADLVRHGEATFLWGNAEYYSAWKITQPDVGPHDYAYLETGAFLLVQGSASPDANSLLNVLKVELPMLAEAPIQEFIPQLTGYEQPPDETEPRMEKTMLVPCTIINDLVHSGDIGWQVANSPFYRLERQVVYKRIYFNYNTTSELQTNSVNITSGISTDSSTTIWESTGVELSVSAGVSFKAFSGSVTATVSEQFGYETQTSVQELFSKTVSTSINIPAHKSAAAWQRYNRYVLYRHNGTELQQVRAWEFGIDSYLVDEYPD